MFKFLEVEFKYNAAGIKLTDFEKFCDTIKKEPRIITASGYDHFYEKPNDSDSFCRLRSGPDMHQLTFKRKTKDANNFVRTEHNIDLQRSTTVEQIEALCSEFGYVYNTSIFKNCFVYKYDTYTFVYYICYDVDMKELGRFIEAEMSEEHAWENEEEAYNHLLILEKLMKPMGVSPQARIKRSLFELYRKDLK